MYKIVETKNNSWIFINREGNPLTEYNMFGGVEIVELQKEDYGFDLKAAEFVEKHYGVEVWRDFPNENHVEF